METIQYTYQKKMQKQNKIKNRKKRLKASFFYYKGGFNEKDLVSNFFSFKWIFNLNNYICQFILFRFFISTWINCYSRKIFISSNSIFLFLIIIYSLISYFKASSKKSFNDSLFSIENISSIILFCWIRDNLSDVFSLNLLTKSSLLI